MPSQIAAFNFLPTSCTTAAWRLLQNWGACLPNLPLNKRRKSRGLCTVQPNVRAEASEDADSHAENPNFRRSEQGEKAVT
jgi:hypothetical protein